LECKRFLCLRNTLRESGVINLKERSLVQIPPRLLSRDLELPVFIIPPVFAWQAGLKARRMVPNAFAGTANNIVSPINLDTMAPVIPTGK
jgi:hypothetical protein